MSNVFVALALFITSLAIGRAQASEEAAPTQDSVWVFQGELGRCAWTGPHALDGMVGVCGAVGLGFGHQYDSWFWQLDGQILRGPYGRMPASFSYRDFQGVAGGMRMGVSLADSFYGSSPGLGAALGLYLAQIEGRSIGDAEDDGATLGRYEFRTRYNMDGVMLWLQPGLIASWLTAKRPQGSDEDLLATRLEGLRLGLWCRIPLVSQYQMRYVAADGSADAPAEVRKKGRWSGYSAFIGLEFLLGP